MQPVLHQQQGGGCSLGQAGSRGYGHSLEGLVCVCVGGGMLFRWVRGFATWVMPPLLLPSQGLQKD